MSHTITTKICPICSKSFQTRGKKKYCTRNCSASAPVTGDKNYYAQQLRGLKRKLALVDRAGGKCQLCGYSKNISALCFHHIDESSKTFGLDLRKCSNSTWESLCLEADKCTLLCVNCHSEIHNPALEMSSVRDLT